MLAHDDADESSGGWFAVDIGLPHRLRVFGVVPGERVTVRPRPDDPPWAELLSVDVPSFSRRRPACSYADSCGGCHWQHIEPSHQHRLKVEAVQRALSDGADDAHDVRLFADDELWGVRYRVRYQCAFTDDGWRFGFHGLRSRRTIDIASCPIAAESINACAHALRELLTSRHGDEFLADLTGVELLTLPGATGCMAFLNPRDRAPASWPECGRILLKELETHLRGVCVRRADGSREVFGSGSLTGTLPSGEPIAAACGGFVQSHLLMADRLAERVSSAVGRAPTHVLELYAGTGLLGRRAASRHDHDVLGIESDGASVSAAQALWPPLQGSFEILEGDAGRAVAEHRDRPVVIADPPRSGLGDLANAFDPAERTKIVLVSCSLRALTADALALTKRGYRITRVEAFDLFPHTRFVEVLTVFEAS